MHASRVSGASILHSSVGPGLFGWSEPCKVRSQGLICRLTLTRTQLFLVTQVSSDVGMMTPEEGEMVKKALVKLKANQLMMTMDGQDYFSSRSPSNNSAVSSSLSRGGSRSSRGSSFVYQSPSSSFSVGSKEANRQALMRSLSSSEKWRSSTIDGNLFGNARVPAIIRTHKPSALSAVDTKSFSMDEIDFRNIVKATSKDTAKAKKLQKFLQRSTDSRASMEKFLRMSADSLGGIREEPSRTSSFQASRGGSFQSSAPLSPGSSFQNRTVAMLKGGYGGSFGKRGTRDGKMSTKGSFSGMMGTKDSMESLGEVSSVDDESEPSPWLQRIVSKLASPFSGNRPGKG